MFVLCHPLPARLPLSDKPLSCSTITVVQRLYLDTSLLSGPSTIFHDVFEKLTSLRGLLGPSAVCCAAFLLFCLCCGCGGWCASSLPARYLMVI